MKRWLPFVLSAAVLGLALLLVKENSEKIAAESRLRDFQLKMDSLSNEKLTVTLDLENQITALEQKLDEAKAAYDQMVADKTAEIEGMNAKMLEDGQAYELEIKGKQSEIDQKSSELQKAEARSKEDASKFDAMLKEKNASINDLGSQLEQASARYSTLLEKSQALEKKALQYEKKITELEASVDRLTRQNAHLLEVVQIRNEAAAAAAAPAKSETAD